MEVLDAFVQGGLDTAPIKRHYAREAIRFYQELPPDARRGLPAGTIAYLFRPHTRAFKWLLDRCTNEELFYTFYRLRQLHESPRLQTVGAAERLLDQAFGSPVVRSRDLGRYVPWQQFIEEKWVMITKGGPNVSRDATRAVMRFRSAEVLHYMENK